MDNPGVIYGCLHIYPVMLWTILGSSVFVQCSKFLPAVILLRTMAIELGSMYTTSVGASAAFFLFVFFHFSHQLVE